MSLIFPEDIPVPDNKVETLKFDIENHPIFIFQVLNKILNDKGLCLSISTIEENKK